LGLDTACVAGLSFGGILALAPQRRHAAMSSASILASAYAGWAGSLPPEVAEQRLRQALTLAKGAPKAFVAALLPTMFSKTMPRETVDDLCASMQAFHPRGFRAMARASAEGVRDVLPHVDVPTLLVYGARDVRAPPTVAEALQKAISVSTLVVLPDAGHLCNIEAPNESNEAVRLLPPRQPRRRSRHRVAAGGRSALSRTSARRECERLEGRRRDARSGRAAKVRAAACRTTAFTGGSGRDPGEGFDYSLSS
jgi:pimeloyl-ACP methyl ester carboxylesterase